MDIFLQETFETATMPFTIRSVPAKKILQDLQLFCCIGSKKLLAGSTLDDKIVGYSDKFILIGSTASKRYLTGGQFKSL